MAARPRDGKVAAVNMTTRQRGGTVAGINMAARPWDGTRRETTQAHTTKCRGTRRTRVHTNRYAARSKGGVYRGTLRIKTHH